MIGVYDSGVGGLSVWRELYALMPEEDYIYFSDGAHCPYGNKPVEFIKERAEKITRFFLEKGAEVVVVACNTATAAAISHLRATFDIPFVGMEPAIKPAVLTSETGVVGVLATANTFKGALYHNTLERFGAGVEVIERVGEGLVEFVERGETSGAAVEKLLRSYVQPMVDAGADAIVLGCTHYPFLSESISKIAGPSVRIINPAPAVAQQTQRILHTITTTLPSGKSVFYSTAGLDTLSALVKTIKPEILDKDIIQADI